MNVRVIGTVLLALSFNACGGSAPAPAQAAANHAEPSAAEPSSGPEASSDSSSAASSAAGATEKVPTSCAKGSDPCTPPKPFVNKLCSGSYPGVALYLFANTTPYVRAYLTGRTQAWNASGGVSETGFLEFDEEVLILRVRKAAKGGMQVSGAGDGYDALRWSGTCVTLAGGELTFRKPPAAKNAKVEFRFLDEPIKEALRQDAALNTAYIARHNECKGATSGEVSLKCVKTDEGLSRAVVAYVRNGGSVPLPEKLP